MTEQELRTAEAFVIVADAPSGGRFWLGRNPQNNTGKWIFECFVTKRMIDWEPLILKKRKYAEEILSRVKHPGAYILQLQ